MRKILLSIALATSSAPALACLPPLPLAPGEHEPTEAERLKRNFDFFTSIVSAEVVEPGDINGPLKLRILHVFKGSVHVGQIIEMPPGSGFDPPPCLLPVIFAPTTIPAGERMLIAFRDVQPARNVISQSQFELMVREGWIDPAPPEL